MKTFSTIHRVEQYKALEHEVVDLLIIGGGITGAGIALDAISRGLSVILLEMQDFAEGTSSRSTKLVHGGLRYLKQFQMKEVAELGRERSIVYENGPHVTTPIWMLLPFYQGGTFGPLTTSIGLKMYDLLAGVKKGERRYMLSREETLKREPLVKEEGLLGGGVYVEYRTDDARLTIEVLKAAAKRGAHQFHYVEVTGFKDTSIAFTEVEAQDHLLNETKYFRARKVVNAAGPWIDDVRKLNNDVGGKHLILSKGTHIVLDHSKFPLEQSIYFDTPDGRMVFAIPRDGKTYVGTTDTFYEGDPKKVAMTKADETYLLKTMVYMFPHVQVTGADIESSWAGVRPLIQEEGKGPSEISRKDEIWEASNGVITIAGGKLTGYRKMAQSVVDIVVKQLGKETGKHFGTCVTKSLPISGGDLSGSKFFEQFIQSKKDLGIKLGLSEDESLKLARFYGTNVDIVFAFVHEATGELPAVIYAKLYYSIYYESVSKPVDFFIRRTGALYFDVHFVNEYKEAITKEMQKIFSWTAEQTDAYILQLNQALAEITLK